MVEQVEYAQISFRFPPNGERIYGYLPIPQSKIITLIFKKLWCYINNY